MMDMTFAQAAVIADELAAAMVEKGLKTPDVWLHVQSGSGHMVWLSWATSTSNYKDKTKICSSKTIDEAISGARAWIASQPNPVELANRNLLNSMSDALEAGRLDGASAEYLTAIRAPVDVMRSNLLAAPVAS